MLSEYKDARRGPTVLLVQSPMAIQQMCKAIPALDEFPRVLIPSLDRCVVGRSKVGSLTDGKEGWWGGEEGERRLLSCNNIVLFCIDILHLMYHSILTYIHV